MSTRPLLKQQQSLYHYVAEVTSVYDGDTITVDLDLGVGIWRRGQTIRLWKINTPELRGAERDDGLMVRDFVRSLVMGKTILVRTILDKRGHDRTGKFGRLLGELLVEDETGTLVNLNQLLIDRGYAVPLGADGSAIQPAAAPRPDGATLPDSIPCPYCGEVRTVTAAGVVEACPNCLDGPYAVAGSR